MPPRETHLASARAAGVTGGGLLLVASLVLLLTRILGTLLWGPGAWSAASDPWVQGTWWFARTTWLQVLVLLIGTGAGGLALRWSLRIGEEDADERGLGFGLTALAVLAATSAGALLIAPLLLLASGVLLLTAPAADG